mmetsp:Transcript_6487/g.19674  ORF Transcript_6487/g.19674 Transcript_6487/m.19674 type:complete len:255 (-) Transcript_6487:265-1029(-)
MRLGVFHAAGALGPALNEVALDVEAQAEHQEGYRGARVMALVRARRVDLGVAKTQDEAHAGDDLRQGHSAHREPGLHGRVAVAARQRRNLRDEHHAGWAQHSEEAEAQAEVAAPDQAKEESNPEDDGGDAIGESHPRSPVALGEQDQRRAQQRDAVEGRQEPEPSQVEVEEEPAAGVVPQEPGDGVGLHVKGRGMLPVVLLVDVLPRGHKQHVADREGQQQPLGAAQHRLLEADGGAKRLRAPGDVEEHGHADL